MVTLVAAGDVGLVDGEAEGEPEGAAVGLVLGLELGEMLGLALGESDGDRDGLTDGDGVGLVLGLMLGMAVGLVLGIMVGEVDGDALGMMLGDAVGKLVGDVVGDAEGSNVGTGGGGTTLSVKYLTITIPGPPSFPPPVAGVIDLSKPSAPMPPHPVVRVWTNVSRFITAVGLSVGLVGDALGLVDGCNVGTVGDAVGIPVGEAVGVAVWALGDTDGDREGLTVGDHDGDREGFRVGELEGEREGDRDGALVGYAYSMRCTSLPSGNAPSWMPPAPQHVASGTIAHRFRPPRPGSSRRHSTPAHVHPHDAASCASHSSLHSSSERSREPPE